MPELTKVITAAELERKGSTTPGIDLTPYMDILDSVRDQGGVGGTLTLAAGESQRTEKRRLSIAAKERGYHLTWRTAPAGYLRFVLAEPGQPAPGGRRRRPRAGREAEQTIIEAVMSPAGADATDATALLTEEPVAPPRARGRRRKA
jgi:hypothetical protein